MSLGCIDPPQKPKKYRSNPPAQSVSVGSATSQQQKKTNPPFLFACYLLLLLHYHYHYHCRTAARGQRKRDSQSRQFQLAVSPSTPALTLAATTSTTTTTPTSTLSLQPLHRCRHRASRHHGVACRCGCAGQRPRRPVACSNSSIRSIPIRRAHCKTEARINR